jgi:hypothetical protein
MAFSLYSVPPLLFQVSACLHQEHTADRRNKPQRKNLTEEERSQNVAISNRPVAAGFFLLRHIASDQLSSFLSFYT